MKSNQKKKKYKEKKHLNSINECTQEHLHLNKICFSFVQGSQIRSCHGCKALIRPPPAIPSPPHDLVAAVKVYRTYLDKSTQCQRMSFKKSWAYFHVSKKCLQKFLSVGTHICCNLESKLHDCHKQKIIRELNHSFS